MSDLLSRERRDRADVRGLLLVCGVCVVLFVDALLYALS